MALQAGTLIDDAELLAYPYVPYPPIPRKTLLRVLGSLDAAMVRLIMAEAPHVISCEATDITIVSASNAAGYTLVEGFQYQQFTYESATGALTPIEILPLSRLDDQSASHPAAVVVDHSKFLPVDPLGKRWSGSETRAWYVGDGDKIKGRRATAPTSPTSLTDTMTSPNMTRDYFIHNLRLHILLQYPGVPEPVLMEARETAKLEKLGALTHAHKSVPINSRFGEKSVGATRYNYDGVIL